MDFWPVYLKESTKPGFASKPLTLKTGDRYNASIARLSDRSNELPTGNAIFQNHSLEKRYLIAREITFDLLVSFYDVNSKSLLAVRPSLPITKNDTSRITSNLSKLKRPNLEMRLIGLQNNEKILLEAIQALHKRTKCVLAEADLFGIAARHIIIDLQTGKPYNLLLLNRIYRPGELNTTITREEFDRRRSTLNFL